MESVAVTLPSSGRTIEVRLERKQMKTCRLKVYPGQAVVLSLPASVPHDWAERFLAEKSTWIEAKLDIFQKTAGYAATTEIKSGYSVKLLGEDMVFSVSQCDRKQIRLEGRTIHLCTPSPSDQEQIRPQFEAWWRKQAEEVLNDRVD